MLAHLCWPFGTHAIHQEQNIPGILATDPETLKPESLREIRGVYLKPTHNLKQNCFSQSADVQVRNKFCY